MSDLDFISSDYEYYFKKQKQKQKEPLRLQEENFKSNLEIERPHLSAPISSVFNGSYQKHDWSIANYYINFSSAQEEFHKDYQDSVLGLELSSKILRSEKHLALKSLACRITLNFSLFDNSTLSVYTRNQVGHEATAVFRFKKAYMSNRTVFAFGGNIGKQNEFIFFKKLELPASVFKYTGTNHVELELSIIDNGDDKVFLELPRQERLSCHSFIPSDVNGPVFVAGSGDGVVVKSITISHINRNTIYDNRSCYSCCGIF